MSKGFRVKIHPDGRVEAKVSGFKGNECAQYISILEDLLDAETVDSEYTEEFLMSSNRLLEAVTQVDEVKLHD